MGCQKGVYVTSLKIRFQSNLDINVLEHVHYYDIHLINLKII